MAKKTNIVKKTRSDINLLVIVIVVLGWIFALSTLTDDKGESEQMALVESAEVFLEDDLYIRAVDNYIEALENYNTPRNPEIEIKLLNLYLEAGMTEEYYDLINERIKKEVASETEYIALAKNYIQAGSNSRAINILNTGLTHYESDEIISLKEEIVYEYKARNIALPEMKQFSASELVPAFNGEKWGYVTAGGDTAIDFLYDDATRFCKGYAVVKLDGVYTLIDEDGYRNAIDENNLDKVTDISSKVIVGAKSGKYQLYFKDFKLASEEVFEDIYLNDNGLFVVKQNGKWAIYSKSLEPVTDFIFTDVAVNSQGSVFNGKYAMVADANGYFLVNEKGEAMYEERYHDAKGYEGGLCAVADSNGKWGFVNEYAELIVDYQYTDACSFSSNLGAVQYGGKWGYINRYNDMKIEPKYESAYPFVEGTALAKTELGSYEALSLKFIELF